MSAAIGIDLGTTACCMAIYRQGQLEVIPNDQGHFTTPSYVAFTGNQRLIGSAAEAQAHRNPSQTLYDAKRLIGRCFDDANVEQLKKNWNFLVVDKENKPMFSTEKPDGSCMLLAPQQVSGMILSKLKKDAESYLARSVTEAVITVPAYFNNAQREATEAAARIAGIKPLRLINEPTAAILSYGHDKKFSVDSKTVLVYDFGGGTLDITIADVDGGVVDVLTTSGDTNLGGRDIDAVVAKYMVQFVDQQCGKGILKVGKAYMRLEKACNEAKHALSTASRAPVVVDGLVNSNDFSTHIIRARFEDLVQPILDRTMKCVEEALEKAKMSGDKIDVVLLVGGSSRIPKIAHMLKVMMTKAEVVYCGNPEESVARGAAVQANILSCEDPYLNAVVLVDVCPLSLGLLTKDNIYSRVIKRSSNIPCEVSQVYRTCFDHQKGILFKVYEGERAIATENNKLGEFRLENIKDALKGEVSYDVTFTLNADGILHVKAVERGTGLSKDITIKKESLDPNDLGAMIEDEEKFAAKDELEVKRIAAKQDLEEYLYELNKRKSPGPSSKLGIKIAEAEKWIDENLNATVEEFKSKKKTFQMDI